MEQLTISKEGYIEIKQKIKDKLNETVNNFIIIGYHLKQVRDSGLYQYDGYRNMEEFAQREYNISAGTASRFMDINTEFSKEGNSLEIKDEYRSFGYSKLQEMLTVRPEDRELITADTTVKQIREIKTAEKEEDQAAEEERQKNLPLMQMAAPDAPDQDSKEIVEKIEQLNPFDAVMTAFWKENMELYTKVTAGLVTAEILAEEICPSGSRTFRSRTNMVFFYDFDKGIKLRGLENGKPVITQHTYEDLLKQIKDLNVAVSEPEPEKREWKIPELEEKKQENTVATSQNEQEEQYTPIEGQTSVSDIPGIVPEERKETVPVEKAESEDVIDAEYREIESASGSSDAEQQEKEERKWSDIDIKNAISYFEMEYRRMTGMGQNTAKCRNYDIADYFIRKGCPEIAKKIDNEMIGRSE